MQILINSLISGLMLALVALGFHIIYSATKIFHIALGGTYVAGAYFFYWMHSYVGFLPAIVLTMLFSFILGLAIEGIVYNPLKNRANDQNITLISSLGVYTILVNLISMLAGNETKLFNANINESKSIGSLIITHAQFYQLVWSVPIITIFLIILHKTNLGLKIRALSNNMILAGVVGIKTQKVRYFVFGIGSIMAVSAAILQAFDTGIDPYSGMSIILSAAVVVIVGGAYSFYGTLIGSFLLSVIQNTTEYFLTAQWKEPITFTILIFILLWRTEGILQFKNRSDEK